MWLPAAHIKQIWISRIISPPVGTKRRTNSVTHIDDLLFGYVRPVCDLASRVLRDRQYECRFAACWADDIAVICAFQCVGIVPNIEMIEIVQSEDESPWPPQRRVVARTEEQIGIPAPQFRAQQNGIERMPWPSGSLKQ